MSRNVKSPFTSIDKFGIKDRTLGLSRDSNILTRQKSSAKEQIQDKNILTQPDEPKDIGEVYQPVEPVKDEANLPDKTPTPDKEPEKKKEKEVPEDVKREIENCKQWEILEPILPTMKKGLRNKGIPPGLATLPGNAPKCKIIERVATNFYNNIARKHQTNNFTGTQELPEVYPAEYRKDHADEAVDAIITGVITYINNVKEKKASGEELNKVEDVVASGAEKAEGAIQEQAHKEASFRIGDWMMSGGWLWILGGIAAIIVVITIARK